MKVKLDETVLARLQSQKEAMQASLRQPNNQNEKLNIRAGLSDTSIAILISSHMELQSDYFNFRDTLLNIAVLTNTYTQQEAKKIYQLCENLLRRFKNTFPAFEQSENVAEKRRRWILLSALVLFVCFILCPARQQARDVNRMFLPSARYY